MNINITTMDENMAVCIIIRTSYTGTFMYDKIISIRTDHLAGIVGLTMDMKDIRTFYNKEHCFNRGPVAEDEMVFAAAVHIEIIVVNDIATLDRIPTRVKIGVVIAARQRGVLVGLKRVESGLHTLGGLVPAALYVIDAPFGNGVVQLRLTGDESHARDALLVSGEEAGRVNVVIGGIAAGERAQRLHVHEDVAVSKGTRDGNNRTVLQVEVRPYTVSFPIVADGVRSLHVQRAFLPDTAAVGVRGIVLEDTSVQCQRTKVADAATATHCGLVARDGNARQGCRSARFIKETTATFSARLVVTMVVRDNTSVHGERAAFSIADTATAVIGDVIDSNHIGERHHTAFVDEGTTGAAPAASQRAVTEDQRGTTTYRDDLTAAFTTLRQLAVQRVATEVDGHGCTTCDTQRTVAEVDVGRNDDVRAIVCYRCTQFAVRANAVVGCQSPLCDRAQKGEN